MLPMPGMQVRFHVRELGSHIPCGAIKNNVFFFNEVTADHVISGAQEKPEVGQED